MEQMCRSGWGERGTREKGSECLLSLHACFEVNKCANRGYERQKAGKDRERKGGRGGRKGELTRVQRMRQLRLRDEPVELKNPKMLACASGEDIIKT